MALEVSDRDFQWMKLALQLAKEAFDKDEVPVGAVLIRDGTELLAADHNRTAELKNSLAHAEKLVIERALQDGLKYLSDCTLYVTLEPCIMCSGLIILSRIPRIIFGAHDSKAGCVGSIYNALRNKDFNWNPEVCSGLLAEESAALLRDFFKKKR
ncbi:MAG: nucleoside deaminase [Candidatus Cloacimonetes bacterium]|nr:nucleoside deaminase [Candidatus Cloacimonadota bacterium]